MRSMMWLNFFTFLMAYLLECVVSHSTVQAFVGTNVLLPCKCPERKRLSWQDLNNSIIASFDGKMSTAGHSQFTNRTQLFIQTEEGNCSLLILGVKMADQGEYKCHSVNPGPLRTEIVNLTVVANDPASCNKKHDEPDCGQLIANQKGGEDISILPRTLELNDNRWAIVVAVTSTLVVALCVLVVYLRYRRKCAQVSNDHVESVNKLDETEDSPLKKESWEVSAEGRAHQCETHMTTES